MTECHVQLDHRKTPYATLLTVNSNTSFTTQPLSDPPPP